MEEKCYDETSMSTKTVLVVDDERPLANALYLKLQKEGITTYTAYNGKECLKFLELKNADVILLDLMMPEMDGFAVLESLQKMKEPPHVIVLSNLGQEEDIQRVKQMGATAYFVKSNVPIREIVDYVLTLLHEQN